MQTMRSLLFVPGDSLRKYERARAGSADALILDLEDAVAPDAKAVARATVAAMLAASDRRQTIVVRVNALTTGLALADLQAVVGNCDAIMLPKCTGPEDVAQLAHYLDAFESAAGSALGATTILPIVTETAASLASLGAYQKHPNPRLRALVWGSEDLSADLGATRKRDASGHSSPFRLARDLCLFAAAALGILAVDTVFTDIQDLDGLEREAREARADGFHAKMAIHPNQVEVINGAFAVTAEERAWAESVLAAFAREPGKGVVKLDGRMVDQPHLKLAQRIVGV